MAIVCIVCVVYGLVGQATGDKPSLTDVQRLQIAVVLRDVEIAQLKLQSATDDFERKREIAQALLKPLMREGWQLDLSKLGTDEEYRPTPKVDETKRIQ